MELNADSRLPRDTDSFILFDIDGTLIEYTPKLEDHVIMEGVTAKIMREKNKTFTRIIMITNQRSTNEKAKKRQLGFVTELRNILPVDVCWLNSERYRKPLPTILQHIEHIWSTKNEVLYIGDSDVDFKFCYNANVILENSERPGRRIKFVHRDTYFGIRIPPLQEVPSGTLSGIPAQPLPEKLPVIRLIDFPDCNTTVEKQVPIDPASRVAYVMVGLPGSGKSTTARNISAHLDSIGAVNKVYNGDGPDSTPKAKLLSELRRNKDIPNIILDYTNGTDTRNALILALLGLGYNVVVINVRVTHTFNTLLLQYRTYTNPETQPVPDIALRTIRKKFSYYDLDVHNIEGEKNAEKITVVNINMDCVLPQIRNTVAAKFTI